VRSNPKEEAAVSRSQSASQPCPFLILVVGLTSLVFGGSVAAAERPNIVFILIDDLGRNDLGCYGSTFHRTPNLDQLARDGVKCTDAYAACPVCSPTRASILTGKYPARLNLTDWLPGRPDRPDQKLLRPTILQHLPLEEKTIASEMKTAGYATALIGKWHLGGEGFEPSRHGFDVNVGGDQTGTARSYFAPFKDAKGVFMPGLEKAPDGEYLTDRLTVEAEKFIEDNRSKPFFLYLPHYGVHIPLQGKEEMIKAYKSDGKPGTQNNPIYAAMVESVDQGVGRIVKKLDELKLTEKTLVICSSDNGGLCTLEGPNTPPTINAPLREGKGYLYEGGIRVPLLMKWPSVIKPGSVNASPISSIDFFPTFLELCGVSSKVQVDGVSLTPVIRDNATLKREALFWHYPHYSNQGGRPGAVVRAGDWKLIDFYDPERRELFNLKDDLSESKNLIEAKPEVAKELQAKLDAWRQDVDAKMMKPNPDYHPNPQASDGVVSLPAKTAEIHGIQLRYEPLPHKNTLGFWTRKDDWASWEFEIAKPGKFTVEVLQGCGKGSGGSEVELSVDGETLTFTVEDTGGFQNFKPRDVGTVTLDKGGRHALQVKAKSKPGVAVMDLRQVKLTPGAP
jgi:arylsulfatase A-like enzyme